MFLLDTNVISELRSGKPQQSPAVRSWAQAQPMQQLYLSAITVLELEMGVLRIERKDRSQGQVLRTWVEAVFHQFEGQVLPFGAKAAVHCAGMHVPNPKSMRDSMLAATALEHRLTLVSRNTVDFAGTAVELFNPWETPWQSERST